MPFLPGGWTELATLGAWQGGSRRAVRERPPLTVYFVPESSWICAQPERAPGRLERPGQTRPGLRVTPPFSAYFAPAPARACAGAIGAPGRLGPGRSASG